MIGVLTNYNYSSSLLEYYGNQVFKMLGLFEVKDPNGYRHAIKIRSEMAQLPFQIDRLNGDERFGIVLAKVDVLIEELFFLDGEHQFVKSHVMESRKLINEIKEGLGK